MTQLEAEVWKNLVDNAAGSLAMCVGFILACYFGFKTLHVWLTK